MKPSIALIAASLLIASCSDGAQEETPAQAASGCMNSKLAEFKSDLTKITYVPQFEGENLSYSARVFWGEYYPKKINGRKIPSTNLVIAAKVPEDYFEAFRNNPPRNYDDYDHLTEKFGKKTNLMMLDIIRHSITIEFIDANVAIDKRGNPKIRLPRQRYLVRDGDWLYGVNSDGPPSEPLKLEITRLLNGIDEHNAACTFPGPFALSENTGST